MRNRLITGTSGVASHPARAPTHTVATKMVANTIGAGVSSPVPMNTMSFGGPGYQTMFSGILPDFNENYLLNYYRDCYYYDAIGGAAVDIMSSLPFSDFTLTGLESKELGVFVDTCDRMNFRSLCSEISTAYLVDSAFVGTLVYDPDTRTFADVLIHDYANVSATPQPFFGIDPALTVNSAQPLNQFLQSGSPFVQQAVANYDPRLLNIFRSGPAVLDPLTTIYLPRKGLRDRNSVSWLKRLLPAYMLERVLFRGTLTEAAKRQRSTSHIMVGDDAWEPTNAEMTNILTQFQQTEFDPLGAWIITRNGVQVNDVRPAGDFWKWTETMESLTPYKLRALGISEAFLSGDASFATAEAAVSVFLDNADAYRQFLTWKVMTNRVFALVAVFNGRFRDPSLAKPMTTAQNVMFNVNNVKNLRVPGVRWHKSLEGENSQSQMELLSTLSEKGFTIPMKMWAAAADVDITLLLRDLEEDTKIREAMEKVTGKPAVEQTMDDDSGMDFSASVQKTVPTHPSSVRALSRRIPLLSREGNPIDGRMSKSGNSIHAMVGDHRHDKKMNELIMKASKSLQDPNRRKQVREQVAASLGNTGMGASL